MASLAYGMFEDQAGSFDWYKQQIGLVERAAFHSVKPRVCVSTQQSAIGCLNLRDGSPAWRKLIDSPAAAFVSVEYHSMAVTVAGGVVRAFDFEGYLKWEQRLSTQASPDTPAIAVALPQAEASGKTYVPTLVYTSGYVKVCIFALPEAILSSVGVDKLLLRWSHLYFMCLWPNQLVCIAMVALALADHLISVVEAGWYCLHAGV